MGDKQTIAILEAARAKISRPEHWTTGVAARTKRGQQINPNDPAAFCFFSFGAIERAVHDMNAGTVNRGDLFGEWANAFYAHQTTDMVASNRINREGGQPPELVSRPTFEYNDTHTHEEVLSLFDEAIASLKAG